MIIRLLFILVFITHGYASELSDSTAMNLCRDYYNSKAFGGSHTMTPLGIRVVNCGEDRYMAHCSFNYKSEFGNEKGTDQRVFFIENKRVIGFGQKNSGMLKGSKHWSPSEALRFIERGYWNTMAHMNPDSAIHKAWSDSAERLNGISHRQMYGIILANWAARQKKTLSKDAINKLMLKARNTILKDSIKHPIIAYEMHWLYSSVAPIDKALATEMQDLCLRVAAETPTRTDPVSRAHIDQVIKQTFDTLLKQHFAADMDRVNKLGDLQAALRILDLATSPWPEDISFHTKARTDWTQQQQTSEELGGLSPSAIYSLLLANSYMHKKDKAVFYLQYNKHLKKIRDTLSQYSLTKPTHLVIAADLWANVAPVDDAMALKLFTKAAQMRSAAPKSGFQRAAAQQTKQTIQYLSRPKNLQEHFLFYSLHVQKELLKAADSHTFTHDLFPSFEVFRKRAHASMQSSAFPESLKGSLTNTLNIMKSFALGHNNHVLIASNLEKGVLSEAINYAAQAERYLTSAVQAFNSPALLNKNEAQPIVHKYNYIKSIHKKLKEQKDTLNKHSGKTVKVSTLNTYWIGTYTADNVINKLQNNNQQIHIGANSATLYPIKNGKPSDKKQSVTYKNILQQCEPNEYGLAEFKMVFELNNGNVLLVTGNKSIQSILKDELKPGYTPITLSGPRFNIELKPSTYGKSAFKHSFKKK